MKTKITFTGEGGWDHQKTVAKQLMNVGQQYTFVGGEMHSSITYFELEEFPGQKFNSCLFLDDDNCSDAYNYLERKFKREIEKSSIHFTAVVAAKKVFGDGNIDATVFKHAYRFGNNSADIILSFLLIKYPRLSWKVARHVQGYSKEIKDILNSRSETFVKQLAIAQLEDRFNKIKFDVRVESFVKNVFSRKFSVARSTINKSV